MQYRLYFLDGEGRFSKAHEFFADDDAQAIAISEGWQEGRRMELWCGNRLVKEWPFRGSRDGEA